MAASKVILSAALALLVQSYKFEPLAQVSPGTTAAGTATLTFSGTTTINRVATNAGPWLTVAPTSSVAVAGTATTPYYAQPATGTPALATGGFTAPIANPPALGATLNGGFIEVAQQPLVRAGGTFAWAPGTTTQNDIVGQGAAGANVLTDGAQRTIIMCAPGIGTEMQTLGSLVDCSANQNNNVLMARGGSAIAQQDPSAAAPVFWIGSGGTSVTNVATPLITQAIADFNGLFLCWAGGVVAATATPQTQAAVAALKNAGAVTSTDVQGCTVAAQAQYQQVWKLGTYTSTPTPTPASVASPSAVSPISPSASPTSGAHSVIIWPLTLLSLLLVSTNIL